MFQKSMKEKPHTICEIVKYISLQNITFEQHIQAVDLIKTCSNTTSAFAYIYLIQEIRLTNISSCLKNEKNNVLTNLCK